MSDKVFDFLRIAAIVILALGTLYGVFADAWGFPYKDAVAQSASGLAVFIEALLQIQSKSFFKDKKIVEVDYVDQNVD